MKRWCENSSCYLFICSWDKLLKIWSSCCFIAKNQLNLCNWRWLNSENGLLISRRYRCGRPCQYRQWRLIILIHYLSSIWKNFLISAHFLNWDGDIITSLHVVPIYVIRPLSLIAIRLVIFKIIQIFKSDQHKYSCL